MYNLIVYLLSIGLLIMVGIGLIGYSYVYFTSQARSFKEELAKPIFLKYIIFGWSFTLLTCFSLAALLVLWTRFYTIRLSLIIISFIISLVSTELITSNCSFGNFIYKKMGNYSRKQD